MDKEVLDLIRSVSGDTSAVVRTYIVWYYMYWTAAAVLTAATMGGIAGYGLWLVKRWQDFVEQARRRE